MRMIPKNKVVDAVADLCRRANTELRPDVLRCLQEAYRREKNSRARRILKAIVDNAREARVEKIALCQDTGLPIVFVRLGEEARVTGGLEKAVQAGIVEGYRRNHLRASVIRDPLARGSSGFGPGVLHVELVPGRRLSLTVLPKGFGCENKSRLKMFRPTADWREIKDFIVESVKLAGPDACPPFVVGVGIGGAADTACLCAKKALLRKCSGAATNKEKELKEAIDCLSIGPMGLGGKTTALAVFIETRPTHIAGLPVAVNISCHALRSASRVL
jgi:fumarate hydratase subunit alpha